MKQNYDAFAGRMIQRYEGPYGWDRADPGGPTKYGITCYDLAAHRGQKMDSMSRWAPIVKAMTLAEAQEIYATKYATAVRFDELNSGVDCVMFDYGVNSGTSRPIRVAAAMMGIGVQTKMSDALLAKINAADPIKFISDMDQERLRFMHAIRGGTAWKEFGGGWGSRVADLDKYSKMLSRGGPRISTAPLPPVISAPKATNVAPKSPGKIGSAVVVGAGGGWTMGISPSTLAITAASIVAVGFAYEVWQTAKAERANSVVHLTGADHAEILGQT